MKKFIWSILIISVFVLLLQVLLKSNCCDLEEKYFRKAQATFIEKLGEDGFQVVSIGGAKRKGKTTGFEFGVSTNEPYDIKTARRILLELSQEFLSIVNNDQLLRSYLFQYPYPAKNVSISVFCEVEKSKEPTSLSMFFSSDGSLFYYSFEPDGTKLYSIVHTETYEEALKIVEMEKDQS